MSDNPNVPDLQPATSGRTADDVREYNPFVSYAFLSALEDSGCLGSRSGWTSVHIALETAGGGTVGVAPAYLKSHSQGEYVFDQGWADAYERAGGTYYPKLQVAVPFTPVTGPRLLAAPGLLHEQAERGLAAALIAVMRQLDVSSAHVTFPTEAQARLLQESGFALRTQQQFQWLNEGYGSYEDFLGALASRKRKQLRRERREALQAGIAIEWLSGSDITEAHWDCFFGFYMDTGSRKWGRPYLNRRFFSLLGERLGKDVLLVMAKRDGRYVAGALNLVGSHAIFGRYWGCLEEHPFLHFEVCYHQAIDYAIARGLSRVEAGAQGEHKLARGYLPVATYSAHAFADPGFEQAVSRYLESEREYVDDMQEALESHAPYRKDLPAGGR